MNGKKFIVWMAENWPAKVLSIAVALILFMFYRMSTLTTRPLSVPLAIEISSTLIPSSSYPHTVRVTLRGEDEGIKSITEGDIEAYIDLLRYETEGSYRAPVQIRKKGSALGVEPLEITVNPLEISIQLDRRITKTLPLTAAIRGRVADGFDMVSHAITPSELLVMGPAAFLEAVSQVQTDPIDLDGRTGDFSMQVSIINPNPLFSIRGSGIVEFQAIIRPVISVRTIDDIPILLVGLDPRFEADFGGKTGSVRFEGWQTQIEDFLPHSSFFTVDCSELSGPGTYVLPVRIDIPGDFSLHRREPEELGITLTIKSEEIPLAD